MKATLRANARIRYQSLNFELRAASNLAIVATAAIACWASPTHAMALSESPACGFTFADSVSRWVGDTPCSMAVEDLDLDGNPDLISANCSSVDLSVLYGIGDGTFGPEQRMLLGVRPGDVAAGDLDGDGFKDIAVNCTENSFLAVYWGQGNRMFSAPTNLATPSGPTRLHMFDLDGDGHMDLVLCSDFTLGQEISVIWGDGTRTPASHSSFPLPVHVSSIGIADLDNDGKSDLAATSCTDSVLYVLLAGQPRQFNPPISALQVSGVRPCMFSFGDLNGDSFPDIAIVDGG